MTDQPARAFIFGENARGQSAYQRGMDLVAEWYDFGEDVIYEFASMVVLGPADQRGLEAAMNIAETSGPEALASIITERFRTWFEFRDFLQANQIGHRQERDLWP